MLGKWTQNKLDHLLSESSKIKAVGSRIDFISRQFLDTEYKESTLTGNITTPEVVVINLEGVDCFTFIDYVEAMRLSASFSEFRENLKRVRYRTGRVSFESRNHFFTDWREHNSEFVNDVTEQICGQKTESTIKTLNKKADSTYFLPGIHAQQRDVQYIPSNVIDDSVVDKLMTGDYAGIYSEREGLDVSHVGIIIKDKDSIFLRHASSEKKHEKVIDQDFKQYISDKPGLIVLRPKD